MLDNIAKGKLNRFFKDNTLVKNKLLLKIVKMKKTVADYVKTLVMSRLQPLNVLLWIIYSNLNKTKSLSLPEKAFF
jgi:translation elongation factor EF-Ts